MFLFLSIPPTQEKTNNLIEVIKLDPSIKLDIRYATKNNFLKRPVYKEAKAYLQVEIAKSLINANKDFKKKGFGLVVFDAYRPWSVTKIFFDEISPEKRIFVANPKTGSIHNRGCAVDVTLYDLKTESYLEMPCDYDTFSEKAFPSYKNGTKEQRENRDLLIKIMKKNNFTVHEHEWWHFNHKDCNDYPVLDIPIELL